MKKKVDILVGICSCTQARDRRDGVRRTWLRQREAGIECVFFLGGDNSLTDKDEEDTVRLDAPDGYNELPAKVFSFFRHALENYEFDWLFKCDDDTYLDLHRLAGLCDPDYDLVGDAMINTRRAPSGGAGYLLKRSIVERLVALPGKPYSGAEDLIVGRLVDKLGGRFLFSPRLHASYSCYPVGDNEAISAHWCSPDTMEAIHTFRYKDPETIYDGSHSHWEDELLFYACGIFRRRNSYCFGRWNLTENGTLELLWQSWASEQLLMRDDMYVGSKTILRPREGNQTLAELRGCAREGSSLPGEAAPLRIHLDCGERRLPGWLNLDAPHYDKALPLLWKDGEVDAYFLEHGLEQLTAASCCLFFREVWRTLRPGGILRIAFIDIRLFAAGQTPALVQFLKCTRSQAAVAAGAVETLLQTQGHLSLWTLDIVILLLKEIGFTVTVTEPGASAHDFLQGLERQKSPDENPFGLLGTTCIEAQKPL